jgi:glycosyltransferase 2 family protein
MAAKRQKTSSVTAQIWRRSIILAIIVLLGYVGVTQVKGLSPSLRSISQARPLYVALALLATISTFFVAAVMYQLLTLHKLKYGRTLLIQIASGFTNRLLPAGLGGMGLIAQYLRKQKHTTSEAVTVVGMDNIIGIIGHFALFFVVVTIGDVSFTAIHAPHISPTVLALTLVVIAIVALLPPIRRAITKAATRVGHDLVQYRSRPVQLVFAMVNSLLLTVLYVSVLWACSYAVGAGLPFAKVIVVFTAGSIIGNATPTPGGLVGTEAGLFGGFVAYGLTSSTALAAALLYRLCTYWLPIAPGLIAFWLAERREKLIA